MISFTSESDMTHDLDPFQTPDCLRCDYCEPIGEGDHLCLLSRIPQLIIDNYTPTELFGWCVEEGGETCESNRKKS